MNTYETALRDNEPTAIFAKELAQQTCTHAAKLYDWAIKHKEDLYEILIGIARKKIDRKMIILAFINDIPRTSPELYPF